MGKGQKKFKITIGVFDLIKGIGMLLIVLVHMTIDYDAVKFPEMYPVRAILHLLSLGVVPMFYIISGFYFKENKIGVTMKKTAKELLVPYAWVGAFVIILFPIFHYLSFRWMPGAIQETIKYFLGFLFGIPESQRIFGIQVHGCNVVWFLYASFVAQNAMNLIFKIRKKELRIVFVILSILSGYYLDTKGISYFCLSRGLFAIGYFYIGYCIKKGKYLQNGIRIWQYGVLLLVWTFFCYWKGGILGLLATYAAGLFFFYLCILFSKFEDPVSEGIRIIGMNTYWLMCIHSVEMCCIPWYIYAGKFPEHPILGFVIGLMIRGTILYIGYNGLKYVSKCLHEKKLKKYT